MREDKPSELETGPEHVPTPEEVRSVFRELIGGEYREVRKREDEKGLYLLEVVVPGEAEGETTEYAYMRKGRYAEGQISTTEIHITFYDKNGLAYKWEHRRQGISVEDGKFFNGYI